ncbi:bifunctional phosphoribosylaminoimidazolecarboxamide formyltransferase/inosine monophosphate cyclohydrolase [Cephaloticoccus primus]|uniref:Bifunctional purine biosynthesis protein PurH n=1 Tax=Cephaloticoccus primus TaxID=1548207 RepID=A0A139SJQ7_9BACT|nr:bifunctional phosphoribosylaminoimidazolecarboxamide formyltransferase/IMP cyclohydrolase [Cephaloticoccus primus]KXU34734.1 bifunctional phosphoribosylaminoimidazolecarboxamide formyltransferase/inosine monophosphate cyclohydrolase [Cephaloticoccus primus]
MAKLALLSVSDKTGLADFATALVEQHGYTLLSTGGTARALAEAGLPVTEVGAHTGFPEIMEGRVKTLHPKIHGGLLCRRDSEAHLAQAAANGIELIDLVVVNLYPFEETVARPGVSFEEAIENIDIGGPSMLRSAAKNHASVTVVCDPADYRAVLDALAAAKETEGASSGAAGGRGDVGRSAASGSAVLAALRQRLALKVFQRTGGYDAAIARYLAGREGQLGGHGSKDSKPAGAAGADSAAGAACGVASASVAGGTEAAASAAPGSAASVDEPDLAALSGFPEQLTLSYRKAQALRYGENPHQQAALYGTFHEHYEQLQGKELSYNNILDISSATYLIGEFERPTVAILKHTNPCGVASADTLEVAWEAAYATDRQAPFGGIIVVNHTLGAELARTIAEIFTEVIIAPRFSEEALAIFSKKKNLRLLVAKEGLGADSLQELRSVVGGVLLQDRDKTLGRPSEFKVVTRRQPSAEEWASMLFAWKICKHVKSNSIVYCRGEQTLGVGAGQMARVDSSRIAVWKAGEAGLDLRGSVVASEALFPFADGLVAAADAGATCAIQPGGSVRDAEVIAAADARGMAMVFTGIRHFRH